MKTYQMILNMDSLMQETPLGRRIEAVLTDWAKGDDSEATETYLSMFELIFLQFYSRSVDFRKFADSPGDWEIVDEPTGVMLYHHKERSNDAT